MSTAFRKFSNDYFVEYMESFYEASSLLASTIYDRFKFFIKSNGTYINCNKDDENLSIDIYSATLSGPKIIFKSKTYNEDGDNFSYSIIEVNWEGLKSSIKTMKMLAKERHIKLLHHLDKLKRENKIFVSPFERISDGIELKVKSYENDLDNYKTCSLNGLSLKQTKFILDLLIQCSYNFDERENYHGNILDDGYNESEMDNFNIFVMDKLKEYFKDDLVLKNIFEECDKFIDNTWHLLGMSSGDYITRIFESAELNVYLDGVCEYSVLIYPNKKEV